MSKFPVLTAVALALLLSTPPALAAKINGKKCTSMVSKQKNPNTGEISYTCRADDGSIQTAGTVEEKAADSTPTKVPRSEQLGNNSK